ncbi:MAG: rubredoxin-like domain-containing protein [Negativicutes bacterium]
MKKLFKCSVCSLIYEGENAPDVCPKCGQAKENYVELSAEASALVYKSERTNDIHMEIITLADQIVKLAKEGNEINLDPNCVLGFTKAIAAAYAMKQNSKAELENHMKKGKW